MYSILADIVVCIHFAFVFFVIFGGFIYFLWRNCPYLHIPAVFGGFWIELSGSICPLTPLENWLSELGGGESYRSNFIQEYIIQFLYPTGLDQNLKYYLAAGLIVINLIIYIHIIRKRGRRKNMNVHDRINERAQKQEKKSLF